MARPATAPTPSIITLATQALARQGQWGVISDLAREFQVHRETVYEVRERAREELSKAFSTDRDAGDDDVVVLRVTSEDKARTVVGMRVVMPASIRDEVAMMPVIYGSGWSYGKIQGTLVEAEERAAEFNASVDLSGIRHVALDEMFSQGRPVLAGIDLDTGYLFALEASPTRRGAEWGEVLSALRDDQGLLPLAVVKDAGSGLAAGVQIAWSGIEERDDLFHAIYDMGKLHRHLEGRAYSAIATVEDLITKRAKASDERDRRSLGQQLHLARKNMDRAVDRHDRYEALMREAQRTLEMTERGSGRLRTSEQVCATLCRIADDINAIGGDRARKLARYLRNRAPGLGTYLDSLQRRLDAVAAEVGGMEVVEAATRAYQASLAVDQGGPQWDRKARQTELRQATDALLACTDGLTDKLARAAGTVFPILVERHRASSMIENLNSVLRPYLIVQKHAEQGFLDLFRFYWNTRVREWGRWKGTTAHEMLTGEKVDDWLALLGYPPSSARVAAAA